MKAYIINIVIVLFTVSYCCVLADKNEEIHTLRDNTGTRISVYVEKGKHWNHKLQIIPILYAIKTPPQIAIWFENLDGEYIGTLYVTEKTAQQNWRKAPGDKTPKEAIRRKSALPYWAHKHGIVQDDGRYMSTKENPLPDAITEATPKDSFVLHSVAKDIPEKFRICAELNVSTDFNEYYPKNAEPGGDGYSGGEWGSGQPAVVYTATIDTTDSGKQYEMSPVGHSSPDGSSGFLFDDMSRLTTGKDIVSSITVKINR
ncbi:MAG: DUF2271 domain-containing protein [Candidatus Latescibacteria bacterium]|nr:DUF2271 domain-containing protein [Candidatus Latescibacterota bacterium]